LPAAGRGDRPPCAAAAPFPRPALGVPAGRDQDPLCELRRSPRLLRALGQPDRPPAAAPLSGKRCGEPGPCRRDLQRPAVDQFLAGHRPRLGQGPRLSAGRGPRALRRQRAADRRGPLRPALVAAARIRGGANARTARIGQAARPRPAAAPRARARLHRSWRPEDPRRDRCRARRRVPAPPEAAPGRLAAHGRLGAAAMTPDAYCEAKAAQSGSSFYYSFRFLPPERRRAIIAVYAFCREVDDVVDELADPGVARLKLAWWRSEIAAVFGGRPQHPVALALVPTVRSFKLEAEHFQADMHGMTMDLDQNRYLDFATLE